MGSLKNLFKEEAPKDNLVRRWFLNVFCVVTVIIIIAILFLSMYIKDSVYSNIEHSLLGRSSEADRVFETELNTRKNFAALSRNYVENFADKNMMEITSVSADGSVLVTSTGFEPPEGWETPDINLSADSPMRTGIWRGRNIYGEKIMSVTKAIVDANENVVGYIRYAVSLERADANIRNNITFFIAVGLLIMLIIIMTGLYFMKSIITPINNLNATARKIAEGDFGVEIQKLRDDEVGRLIDTINDMASELNANEKMKNDFISSISHELRTPLTAIKGWAETLNAGDTDQEIFSRGMGVIIRESERLTGLVEELLDFSRLQSGRIVFHMEKVDIISELDEAVFMFTDRANTEKKELDYDVMKTLPPVTGDVNRLRQVFVNIIDNAIKYTEPGGTIKVEADAYEDLVRVIISDTGCGIPAKDLPNVKKKFYKANQLVQGSGIGLALADEIISFHKGSLTVDSVEGEGTTVTIILPAAK